MKVDMTEDCQEITVYTMNPAYRKVPVFYASLQCGSSDAETLKHLLVLRLWDYLVANESPLRKRDQFSGRADSPIQLARDLLGKPNLLLGEYKGPAISFSKGGGHLWAALCGDESDIGIDVAGPDEFQSEYPVHRVFHPQELQHALMLTDDDLQKASALLWSIKEAVVKALGCAFHLVDPLQIIVYPSAEAAAGENGCYAFPVELSGKAMERFPLVSRRSLWVRSFPQGKMWLSIALLNRRPKAHE
jgi:phosphopantetheinyl transferase (holo-ACP synthase)